MPDHLTAEERAAIAAFPPGQIYQCARGETSLPINGIVPKERQRIAVAVARRHKQFWKSKLVDDQICALVKKGLTDLQISQKVKLTKDTIGTRRRRLGLAANLRPLK